MISASLGALGIHAELKPVLILDWVLGLCGLLESRDHLLGSSPMIAAALMARKIEVVTLHLHLDMRLDLRDPVSIAILSSTHFILTY